jgi:hypothetical protein
MRAAERVAYSSASDPPSTSCAYTTPFSRRPLDERKRAAWPLRTWYSETFSRQIRHYPALMANAKSTDDSAKAAFFYFKTGLHKKSAFSPNTAKPLIRI